MRTIELIELYKNLNSATKKVSDELRKRLDWEELYTLGFAVQAIIKYRDANPKISLLEAKKAVEKHFNK